MALKAKKLGRIKGGSGEVCYDNRSGPVPLHIRAGDGSILIVPAGGMFEGRCYTCAHCNNRVVILVSRTRPRASCPRCRYTICDRCAATGFCSFIDDLIDLHLARPGTVTVGTSGGLFAATRLLEERRPR